MSKTIRDTHDNELKAMGWRRYVVNEWREGYVAERNYWRDNEDGTAQTVCIYGADYDMPLDEFLLKADKSPRLKYDDYKSRNKNGYALQYRPTRIK